jgi:hypothetical protein
MDTDEEFARRLQMEYDNELLDKEQIDIKSQLQIELNSDYETNLHSSFLAFNQLYFDGLLASVEVRWSKRMTLCAGMCYYYPGGYCSVRLSEPLLKFRPKSDFIDTLLHEMIHAYLFITSIRISNLRKQSR